VDRVALVMILSKSVVFENRIIPRFPTYFALPIIAQQKESTSTESTPAATPPDFLDVHKNSSNSESIAIMATKPS
jgi:hypothetical protein